MLSLKQRWAIEKQNENIRITINYLNKYCDTKLSIPIPEKDLIPYIENELSVKYEGKMTVRRARSIIRIFVDIIVNNNYSNVETVDELLEYKGK